MADTLKSTSNPERHGQIVINPDGSNIGDTIPTEGNNPALVLGYTGATLTTLDKVINGTTYRKTFTYDNGVLTQVSAWVKV
jgi:hypothetical protein